ncbi:hypothetical protein PVAP13_5NG506758 [Panicum virgatum]|uniref:Uncharacterized protein n=1 Tax=Panicum virgatum TaxID=38727 RepID=A0A8T0S2C1_PANVG|nr:hypothetical protein PVAP13_5NG506758 [Panicum virgatum]
MATSRSTPPPLPPRSPSLSSAAAPAQRARSGGFDLGPWRRRPDPRGATAVLETRGARRGEAVCGASCRTCRRRSRPVLARRHTGLLRATAAASPSSSAGAVASPRPRRPAEGGDQDPRRRRLRPTLLRHREHPLLRRRRRAWLAADGSKRRGGLLPASQTGRPSSCSTGLPGKRSSSSATTADLSRTGCSYGPACSCSSALFYAVSFIGTCGNSSKQDAAWIIYSSDFGFTYYMDKSKHIWMVASRRWGLQSLVHQRSLTDSTEFWKAELSNWEAQQ